LFERVNHVRPSRRVLLQRRQRHGNLTPRLVLGSRPERHAAVFHFDPRSGRPSCNAPSISVHPPGHSCPWAAAGCKPPSLRDVIDLQQSGAYTGDTGKDAGERSYLNCPLYAPDPFILHRQQDAIRLAHRIAYFNKTQNVPFALPNSLQARRAKGSRSSRGAVHKRGQAPSRNA
jgi:hypothetical protein